MTDSFQVVHVSTAQKGQVPVHELELVRGVDGQFEAHLHDGAELDEFVVVHPAAEAVGEGWFVVAGLGVGDGSLVKGALDLAIEILGLELDLVPLQHGVAHGATHSGPVETKGAKEVQKRVGGAFDEDVELGGGVELSVGEYLAGGVAEERVDGEDQRAQVLQDEFLGGRVSQDGVVQVQERLDQGTDVNGRLVLLGHKVVVCDEEIGAE